MDRKYVPRITDWHHKACRVMTIGDCEGRIFLPILTRIIDYFSCLPRNTSFILKQHGKDFQKILNMLECDMMTSFLHLCDVTDRRAASGRLFVFYPSLGLVRVCEISHG